MQHYEYTKGIREKCTAHLDTDLCVRAVVLSAETLTGYSSVNYTLEASEGPYALTLVQNPLIDYPRALEVIDSLVQERANVKRVCGIHMEPEHCSLKIIREHWMVAHWYCVDEHINTGIVGMSVAVWEGTHRIHKILR